MADVTIFTRATDEVFGLSTTVLTSSVAPSASYDLATLQALDPAQRVIFPSGSLTLTWTLAAPVRGKLFFFACSNLDVGGSPNNLRLTNGAGLSVSLTVPALPPDGIPLSIVVDLVAAVPNNTTATSNVWHLIIENSVAVKLGAAIALYSAYYVPNPDLQFGFKNRGQHAIQETVNAYRKKYRMNYETKDDGVDAIVRVDSAQLYEDLKNWYDANCGRARPSVLWPQGVTGLDAMLGTWQEVFQAANVADAGGDPYVYDVTLSFDEDTKGKPF